MLMKKDLRWICFTLEDGADLVLFFEHDRFWNISGVELFQNYKTPDGLCPKRIPIKNIRPRLGRDKEFRAKVRMYWERLTSW